MNRCLAHRLAVRLQAIALAAVFATDSSPAHAGDSRPCSQSALLLQDFGHQFEACHELAYDGDPAVEFTVAEMYILGRGVPVDYEQGTVWLRRSADQGFAPAQAALGEIFRQGRGLDRNAAEGAKWCRRAAEQGFVQAELRLAADYAEGSGVPRDDVLAYMWLTLASAEAPDAAHQQRHRLARRMTAEQITMAEDLARAWGPGPSVDRGSSP